MERWRYTATYRSPQRGDAVIEGSVLYKTTFDEALEEVRSLLRYQTWELVGLHVRKD